MEKINYKDFISDNNKYTFLILHGWGWSSKSWLEVWELLFKSWFNVIIPDLPWFWETKINKIFDLNDYAKTIEKFIETHKIKNIILMWHSNGWAISIKLVNRWNIKIEKLILNNSAWIRNDKKRSLKRKFFNNIAKKLKFLKNKPWFKKLRTFFYKAIWSHDYLNAENNKFLLDTYKNMISSDLKEDIKNIDLDTLLIRWEKDTYTPLSDAYFMRENIKKSKLVILDNEKHWIHLQNPKRLTKTILENI